MSSQVLNLTRKWRSVTFDEIVGQELPVRMLKNSLYVGNIFPVYLFAGQRGCGKTSTARVFAAAINCEKLTSFQSNPKQQVVPCGSCASCQVMRSGTHPDFIEIDAASHTGVDNVRSIIDAAACMPVLSSKKIYLIDEAHMLSRSAFNAFLKILEEPPASAVFMLATTDWQKIIETVRSRCFQIFFSALPHDALAGHLRTVCEHEGIAYDEDGLSMITRESGGSARDALNLLEQVRFASGRVTRAAVQAAQGHLADDKMLELVEVLVRGQLGELLTLLDKTPLEQFSPPAVWYKLSEIVRSVLRIKHGVAPAEASDMAELLTTLAARCEIADLCHVLEYLYDHEMTFLKTASQKSYLEMTFMQLCYRAIEVPMRSTQVTERPPLAQRTQPMTTVAATGMTSQRREPVTQVSAQSAAPGAQVLSREMSSDMVVPSSGGPLSVVVATAASSHAVSGTPWQRFLEGVSALGEPGFAAALKDAVCALQPDERGVIVITLPKHSGFLQALIDKGRAKWEPLFHEHFGARVMPAFSFTGESAASARSLPTPPTPVVRAPVQAAPPQRTTVDVSDTEKWKTANALLATFSGALSEVPEGDADGETT